MNRLRSLVISSFFLSQLLFSQALDDSNGFLESLPKSLQPDILRELAAQSDMPDPKSYRGPRTTVEQLEFALEKIRYQLVEIEEELSDEDSF